MTRIHEAVILAGGLGTRMRRKVEGVQLDEAQQKAAAAGTKAMIDVGRPFLDHVLSALADAGIDRAIIVIGPSHDEMRRYYTELPTSRITVELAVQPEPLGTANALLAAEGMIHGDHFILLNSDNYYPVEALSQLAELPGAGLVGFVPDALVSEGNIEAERVAAFALVSTDEAGHMVAITEKPTPEQRAALGDDPLVSMNCWALPSTIFDQAHRVPRSSRGEYELPDAVRLAISEGVAFDVVRVAAGVLDLSSQTDIASVAERLSSREVRL